MSIPTGAKPDIIFILGIMPRSGTNFLANILCQHPDCTKSAFPEDGLVDSVRFLKLFSKRHFKNWTKAGNEIIPRFKSQLLKNLGDGLTDYLRQTKEILIEEKKKNLKINLPIYHPQYIVTKTPSVQNINDFFSFFPDQKLIVIVRDGRSLVESSVTSFKWDFETIIKEWAFAADTIKRFEQAWAGTTKPYILIKYEDLNENTEKEMHKILSFLNLDIAKYNFENASNMPITGSSTFKRGDGGVHWLPVAKTKDFDPLNRAAGWIRAKHERFNWLAAKQLTYFGYEPRLYNNYKVWWKIWNIAIDVKVKFIKLLKKIKRLPYAIRMA